MKKILIYLKCSLAAGIVLLNNVTVLPMQDLTIMNTTNVDDAERVIDETERSDTSINQSVDNNTDDPEKVDEPNPDDETEDPDEEPEMHDFGTDLIIRAVNPGYSEKDEDGQLLNEAGEFIELENLTGTTLELAGYSLRYYYGSKGSITFFTFPEGSYLAGKHLLLSYAGSANAENVDLTYSRSLALEAGPLVLFYEDEVVDSLCWRSTEYCKGYNTITKFNQTVAVRNLYDEEGKFEVLGKKEYIPDYNIELSGLYLPPELDESDTSDISDVEVENLEPKCQGLEFSELLTYYSESQDEQFIEFYNSSSAEIDLSYCQLNYKNKSYGLGGTISPGGYLAYYPSGQFSFTKNPKNPLTLTLIDYNQEVVDEMAYPNGQKKTTSYARTFTDGVEDWQITYAPTPNAENIYQKYRSCEEGKVINEATGNCIKDPNATSASSTSIASKLLEPCPEGKYRNPLTGRCKNIETTSTTLKPCAEGYERNPETNRCRKVTSTSGTGNDGADYALAPKERSDSTVFIGVGIVSGIVLLGGTYVVLQFRHEIARTGRKIGQRCNRIRQNLLARCRGWHRDKKP